MIVTIDDRTRGKQRTLGIPIQLSDTPGGIRTPPVTFGAHTAEVLAEIGKFRGVV